MSQLIHWLLTGAAVLAALISVTAACAQSIALRNWTARVRRAGKTLEQYSGIPDRLDALERGAEIASERHHAHIGRHGALVARVNKLERGADTAPDGGVDFEADLEAARESERRELEQKLARRNGG